jgi:tetratricopeptide (TPR) repeat protein
MKAVMAVTLVALLSVLAAGCGPSNKELVVQGRSQLDTGNLEQAKALFQRVLDRRPHDPDALYYMGRTYHQQGLFTQAIYYYKCAMDLDPAFAAAAHYKRMAEEQLQSQPDEPAPAEPAPDAAG